MVGTMILAGLASLAAMQSASEPEVPTCSLVAPNGDLIGFKLSEWNEDGSIVGLVGTRGAVWPSRTIVGRRLGEDGNAFAFGGEVGILLRIGEARDGVQPAALHRRKDDRAGIPLAFGFCRSEAPFTVYRGFDGNVSQIDDDIPTFDPAGWPKESCAMIVEDGRRMRLHYRLTPDDGIAMRSPELWGERQVTGSLRRGRPARGGYSISRFTGRGGLNGSETFFVDREPPRAAKLIAIDDPGGAASGRSAFAICGYSEIQRRPSRR